MRRNNVFCYVLIMKWLHHTFRSVDFLHHCLLFFIYMQNCEMAASIRQRVGRKLIFPIVIVFILFVSCHRLTAFGYLEQCSRRADEAAIGAGDEEGK